MNRITKLTALAAATLAALTFAAPANAILGGGGGPYNAPPSVQVYGPSSAPQVAAQNNRQFGDRTAVVITSLTPSVCTVPANSASVGTYQQTPRVQVTVVRSGTCTVAADQAASGSYVAGHAERSFSVR